MAWLDLKHLLQEHLQRSPWRQHIEAARTLENVTVLLRRRFSNEVMQHITVAHLKEGVITLRIAHPAVAQAVQLESQQFLDALRSQGLTIERFDILIEWSASGSR